MNSRLTLEPSQETARNEMRAHYKRNLFDSQPLDFTNVAKFVPPEIRHLNRQTDGHKSRFRLYIDRGERLGRVVVKNSVLPRWRSAAIKHFHSTYVKQDSFVIIPPTYSCFILQVKKILLKVYTIHQYIILIASFKSIL